MSSPSKARGLSTPSCQAGSSQRFRRSTHCLSSGVSLVATFEAPSVLSPEARPPGWKKTSARSLASAARRLSRCRPTAWRDWRPCAQSQNDRPPASSSSPRLMTARAALDTTVSIEFLQCLPEACEFGRVWRDA